MFKEMRKLLAQRGYNKTLPEVSAGKRTGKLLISITHYVKLLRNTSCNFATSSNQSLASL
ncbi:Uncharacterised protein [Bacillus freudenreichii]|nr:Uncharacterised protein [Bacillus freudenreichii]